MADEQDQPVNDNPPDFTIPDEIIEEVLKPEETPETSPEPEPPKEPEKKEDEPPVPAEEPEKPEENAEPKTEDKKPEEVKLEPIKVQTDEEVEAELAQIQPSPHAHANTKEGFAALKKLNKEKAAALRRSEQEKADIARQLEQVKTKPLPEEVEKELEELRKERKLRNIEADPEFKSKFDAPIKKLDDESVAMLEGWGLPEKVKTFISDNGGVVAMKYSDKLMPDGKNTQAQWFKSEILDNIESPKQLEDIEDNIREARQLQRQREREIAAAKENATQWETEKTEKQKREMEQSQQEAIKIRDEIIEKLGPQAQEWTPKPDATPEEKEQAEWHNKTLKESAEIFQHIAQSTDQKTRIAADIAASQAHYLSALVKRQQTQLEEVKKQNKELSEKLGKISNSGRTAKQSNAPATKTAPKTQDLDSIIDEVMGKQS